MVGSIHDWTGMLMAKGHGLDVDFLHAPLCVDRLVSHSLTFDLEKSSGTHFYKTSNFACPKQSVSHLKLISPPNNT